jgi:hypothetical protein
LNDGIIPRRILQEYLHAPGGIIKAAKAADIFVDYGRMSK